ncbi:S8 family serine peptidase [Actinoplanes couchii]|uniref:Serine protease n=1 Tax=Actinoplanes couchii TaxID=403638 RepID=A0ABQ3XRY7_9ACTN|nr:S8 family serine peptidase [Actinoplanes couchii]MDR6318746.1 subtilisin family serine protease [Actinoplanes couchii]GID61274.1 serine protease [Actinoplanes couchii]
MRFRRSSAALLAVTVAAAVGAVSPVPAAAAPVPAAAAHDTTVVTLITGDEVTFTDDTVSVHPAPGRERVRFTSQRLGEHRYVIPLDALPLLHAGRVDRRLFDLTQLREFGYTGRAELPLIVAYAKGGRTASRTAIAPAARVTRDLSGVGALAVHSAVPSRAELWTAMTAGHGLSAGLDRIYLDGKRELALDVSVPQVGAPAAWQRGLDGTGVTVAVLDSGIDAAHPDFAGKIVARENFTAAPTVDDVYGHGTHVASIVAGTGAASSGAYRGVAPGARLVIGKVCEDRFCDDSAILAGMQWAAPLAPVINMSLGGYDAPGIDPLEQAVEDLTAAHGTLFVVAAGNMGLDGDYTVASPGTADAALTVGAVDDEDQIAGFSSRGPRLGDEAIKPDITAPGVEIVAAAAEGGVFGAPAADGYISGNGTSMAAPHVAGAAALLTQQHPDWSPRQRKTVLMGAAEPTAGAGVFAQGAGRLDVDRATRQAVSADEGSLSYGLQRWPHDEPPIARTLTYRNGGTADVTLSLAVDADRDTFAVSVPRVTVPAGGTAQVTVTADTSAGSRFGEITGRVTATGDGVVVVTPVAVNREAESYPVTLRHTGRDGQESANYWTVLTSLTTGAVFEAYAGDGGGSLRLPRGDYALYSQVYGENDTTLLVQPTLVVDGAATVDLDARRGRPVVITPPRRDAGQAMLAVHASWARGEVGTGVTVTSAVPGDTFTAQVGGGRADGFWGLINSAYARPDGAGGFTGSPYSYEATYQRAGTFWTGFTRTLTPGAMARVDAHYPREAAGDVTVVKTNRPVTALLGNWTADLRSAVPFRRTEWLNTDGDLRWAADFEQRHRPTPEAFPDTITGSSAPATRLTAGRTYRQDWNRAVFAPSVAGNDAVVRRDDVIVAAAPLFGDGGGHPGWSQFDRGRAALYANGTLIGEEAAGYAEFPVPAARTPYRLEMSAARGAPHRLSTSVAGVWTFTSAAGDQRLPLSTVRFSPDLDEQNTAPAGSFAVPVTVEPQPGSAARPTRRLTAEFSTDDGRTWRPARVAGSGDRRVLTVTNPAGPGAVSLRVHAIDQAGNTTTITVVRAYLVS